MKTTKNKIFIEDVFPFCNSAVGNKLNAFKFLLDYSERKNLSMKESLQQLYELTKDSQSQAE